MPDLPGYSTLYPYYTPRRGDAQTRFFCQVPLRFGIPVGAGEDLTRVGFL